MRHRLLVLAIAAGLNAALWLSLPSLAYPLRPCQKPCNQLRAAPVRHPTRSTYPERNATIARINRAYARCLLTRAGAVAVALDNRGPRGAALVRYASGGQSITFWYLEHGVLSGALTYELGLTAAEDDATGACAGVASNAQ